jgi:hypothetical protein
MHATRGKAAGAAIACRSTRKTKAANVLQACNTVKSQSMMKDDQRMKKR